VNLFHYFFLLIGLYIIKLLLCNYAQRSSVAEVAEGNLPSAPAPSPAGRALTSPNPRRRWRDKARAPSGARGYLLSPRGAQRLRFVSRP